MTSEDEEDTFGFDTGPRHKKPPKARSYVAGLQKRNQGGNTRRESDMNVGDLAHMNSVGELPLYKHRESENWLKKGSISQMSPYFTPQIETSLSRVNKNLSSQRTRTFVRAGLTVSVWVLVIVLGNMINVLRDFDESGTLDATAPLSIMVGSCDINFVQASGTEGTVTITGSRLHESVDGHLLELDTDQETVKSVFASMLNCQTEHRGGCSPICKIEVGLPRSLAAGATWGEITIEQVVGSEGTGMAITAAPGMFIGMTLNIEGPDFAIDLSETQLGQFGFEVGGPIILREVVPTDGTANKAKASAHSVYYSSSTGNIDYNVQIRQPDGRYRVRGVGDVTVDPPVVDTDLRCPITQTWQRSRLLGLYDGNGDGFTDIEEFRAALTHKVPMCCSENCPYPLLSGSQERSECDFEVQRFFPGIDQLPTDDVGKSRYGRITNGELVRALQNVSNTALFPGCYDYIAVRTTPASGATRASVGLKLSSKTADATMVASPTAGTATDAIVTKIKPPTMKLDFGSATMLRDLANEFGRQGDVKADLFLTVVIGSGPGLPASSFVYTTRPMLFTMVDPAYMALVGASSLLPTLKTVSIGFTYGPEFYTDGGMNLDALVPQTGPYADARSNGAVITYRDLLKLQTYEQLGTALTPSGQSSLKGLLVRIAPDANNLRYHRYYRLADYMAVGPGGTFDTGRASTIYTEAAQQINLTESEDTIEVEFTDLAAQGNLVFQLNLLISGLLGLAISLVASAAVRAAIIVRKKELMVSLQTGTKQGGSASTKMAKSDPQAALLKIDVRSGWFRAAELPLEVISILFPYRSVCFNSLRKFWTSRIDEFDHKGKDPLDAGNLYIHETAVPYVDFLIEYERFCKINHLKYEDDSAEIRKFIYLQTPASVSWFKYNCTSLCKATNGNADDAKTQHEPQHEPQHEHPDQGITNRVIFAVSGLQLNAKLIQLMREILDLVEEDDHNADNNNIAQAQISNLIKRHDGVKFNAPMLMNEKEAMIGEQLDQLETVLRLNRSFDELIRTKWTSRRASGIRKQRVKAVAERKEALLKSLNDTTNYTSSQKLTDRPLYKEKGCKVTLGYLAHACAINGDSSSTVSINDFATGMAIFSKFARVFELLLDPDDDYTPGGTYWDMPKLRYKTKRSFPAVSYTEKQQKRQLKLGLFQHPRYNEWLAGLKIGDDETGWGIKLNAGRRMFIYGATLRDESDRALTWLYVKEVLIDALVQLLYVMLPGMVLLFAAFRAHFVYLQSTAAVTAVVVDAATLGQMELAPMEEYYAGSYILFVATIVGSLTTAAGVLHSQLATNQQWWSHTIIRKVLGIGTSVYYFGVLVFLTMMLLWQIVSGIIDPDKNLTSLAAVVVIFVSLNGVVKQLLAQRLKVSHAVRECLDQELLDRLAAVMDKLDKNPDVHNVKSLGGDDNKEPTMENLFDTLIAADLDEGEFADSDEEAEVDEKANAEAKSDVQYVDLPKFCQLFRSLGFNLSIGKLQSMFAFADLDGNGLMDKNEFDMSWLYLKDDITKQCLAKLFLSDGDILVAVLFVILLFGLTLPFIFTVITLYSNSGSFESVIHTIIIGSTGLFSGGGGAPDEEGADGSGRSRMLTLAVGFAIATIGSASGAKAHVESDRAGQTF